MPDECGLPFCGGEVRGVAAALQSSLFRLLRLRPASSPAPAVVVPHEAPPRPLCIMLQRGYRIIITPIIKVRRILVTRRSRRLRLSTLILSGKGRKSNTSSTSFIRPVAPPVARVMPPPVLPPSVIVPTSQPVVIPLRGLRSRPPSSCPRPP